jgi:hypothetical protein
LSAIPDLITISSPSQSFSSSFHVHIAWVPNGQMWLSWKEKLFLLVISQETSFFKGVVHYSSHGINSGL